MFRRLFDIVSDLLKNYLHVCTLCQTSFRWFQVIAEFENESKINKGDEYNKNICIVSPYFKTEDKLYKEQDIKQLFEKKNEI